MANREFTLEPIVGPGKHPLKRLYYTGILGTERAYVYPGKLADYLETPGMWSVESMQVHLVCDATVANRQVIPGVFSPETGVIHEGIGSDYITASQTRDILVGHWSDFANMAPTMIAGTTAMWAGLNGEYNKFAYPEYWQVQIAGGVAGDVWSLRVTFRCLNKRYGLVWADKPRKKGCC